MTAGASRIVATSSRLQDWHGKGRLACLTASRTKGNSLVSRVIVYRCSVHELDENRDVFLPGWRTREAFERNKPHRMKLELHEYPAFEIDASLVDADGCTADNFDPWTHPSATEQPR